MSPALLRVTRSEAERTRKRASLHSHMGLLNNAISRKLLIFPLWSMEQIFVLFDDIIDIRDVLAQPGRNAH